MLQIVSLLPNESLDLRCMDKIFSTYPTARSRPKMVLRPPVMSAFVEKASPGFVPSDAVRLSREEAAEKQWNFIKNWKSSWDVWPFTYGVGSLSLATAVSSLMISNHYRKKLKLRHYGRISMFIPTAFIPSVLIVILHSKFVTEEILLQNECPVCIQMRAVVMQTVGGIIYPAAISPFAAFGYSTVYGTYRVPLFKRENLGEIYDLWRKLSRPLQSRLLFMWAAHVGLAAAITNAEAKSLFRIYKKARLERDTEKEFMM
ncbi:hypothetical protein AAG570_002478 [Ranatra chinensis]|uniref:Uncharacterized protein n=1 Tax=Ranatra chinensis TaxID=642074 RepID=A0ABD0YUD5_9HEMI